MNSAVLGQISRLNKLALISLIICKVTGVGTAAMMIDSLWDKTLMTSAHTMLYVTLATWGLAFILPLVQWLREQ